MAQCSVAVVAQLVARMTRGFSTKLVFGNTRAETLTIPRYFYAFLVAVFVRVVCVTLFVPDGFYGTKEVFIGAGVVGARVAIAVAVALAAQRAVMSFFRAAGVAVVDFEDARAVAKPHSGRAINRQAALEQQRHADEINYEVHGVCGAGTLRQ